MARSLNRNPALPTRPHEETIEPAPAAEPPAARPAPRRKRAAAIPAFQADNDAVPDFSTELEAALMSDIQAADPLWGDEAEHPAAASRPLREAFDLDQVDADYRGDRLAFETLIRGRQDRVRQETARQETARQDHPRQNRWQSDLPAATTPRPRIERSQAPAAVPERSSSGGRWVAAPPDENEAPAAPGSAVSRRHLGIIAIITALVGVGAVVTLQSVKARTEQQPGTDAVIADATPLAGTLPASGMTGGKESYDRAPADQSLPEAPQSSHADLTSVSPVEKSPLPVAIAPVAAPVVAGPAAAAADRAPVAEAASPAEAALAAEAPPAAQAPAAPAVVAALTPSTVKKPSPPATAGAARIASAVKLRAGPDNNATTVALLQAGTTVNVVRCKGWCEIVANGQHGYVFQKFITPAKRGAAKAGAAPINLF